MYGNGVYPMMIILYSCFICSLKQIISNYDYKLTNLYNNDIYSPKNDYSYSFIIIVSKYSFHFAQNFLHVASYLN